MNDYISIIKTCVFGRSPKTQFLYTYIVIHIVDFCINICISIKIVFFSGRRPQKTHLYTCTDIYTKLLII